MKRKIFALFAVLLAALLVFSACGSSSDTDFTIKVAEGASSSYGFFKSANASTYLYADDESAEASSTDEITKKLIKTASATVETKEFDKAITTLRTKAADYGGYIERQSLDSYSSSRDATLVFRIPAEKFDAFLGDVDTVGSTLDFSSRVQDVTTSYASMVARIELLTAQVAQYEELLKTAKDNAEIVSISKPLAEAQNELVSLKAELAVLDKQVSYSTLTLSLYEVSVYTPTEKDPAFRRIGQKFVDALSGIGSGFVEVFVWFFGNLPYIVLVGAAGFGIAMLLRYLLRKKGNGNNQSGKSE